MVSIRIHSWRIYYREGSIVFRSLIYLRQTECNNEIKSCVNELPLYTAHSFFAALKNCFKKMKPKSCKIYSGNRNAIILWSIFPYPYHLLNLLGCTTRNRNSLAASSNNTSSVSISPLWTNSKRIWLYIVVIAPIFAKHGRSTLYLSFSVYFHLLFRKFISWYMFNWKVTQLISLIKQ